MAVHWGSELPAELESGLAQQIPLRNFTVWLRKGRVYHCQMYSNTANRTKFGSTHPVSPSLNAFH